MQALADVRARLEAALAAFVERVQADRTIIAAIFSNLFSAYEEIDIVRYADAHIALVERALRVPGTDGEP